MRGQMEAEAAKRRAGALTSPPPWPGPPSGSLRSYNKRGAKATCCAFEKPPRAQAFRAADAGLARSGLRNPARALGARAAP
ncbi:unnamed protein product [Rangifer tarandus platyrhynchus]|uniref:Uncharacterized protein n=1 Tax=Rangifer tarandus platyrhynchus TaxID=3082113 RepID=A0AC59ZWM8_RANTA